MTYKEFKNVILDEVKELLDDGMDVIIQEVTKTNDLSLDGLTIVNEQSNISPTIYLNQYYQPFKKGDMSISDIVEDIMKTYNQHKSNISIDTKFFTDFDAVKGGIVYRIVNTEKNQKLLETTPHINFLDLSIIFFYIFNSQDEGIATILIKNPHLEFWNTDVNTLYRFAKFNTPRIMGLHVQSMLDLAKEITPDFVECKEDIEIPLYIFTNNHKMHGACVILYPEILKFFAEAIGSDLYILPSSVHEVLIVPTACIDDDNDLTEMVQEVNRTQVAPNEFLADHAYFYNRATDKITY